MHPTYLPMEVLVLYLQLCTIVDRQRYTQPLNGGKLDALGKVSSEPSNEREEAIMQIIHKNKYDQECLVSQEFGMLVAKEHASTKACVLPSPIIKYQQDDGQQFLVPMGDGGVCIRRICLMEVEWMHCLVMVQIICALTNSNLLAVF